MKRFLFISGIVMLFLSSALSSSGQGELKLRIGGNSTRFLAEPQGKEKNYPPVDTLISRFGPFLEFTDKGGLGYEAELMISLSDNMWFGLEVGRSRMSGENDDPGWFNFQFSDQLQLLSYDTVTEVPTIHYTYYPVKYNTSLFDILGNFRFYPSPYGSFRPFIKLTAGVSLVSTELSLTSPELWYDDIPPKNKPGPPILYSRGTGDSEKGLQPAFTFGGGIGFEFQLTERISLYADGTFRTVNSGIIDGKPNFDYDDTVENPVLTEFNTRSNISKFSFGIVYTLKDNMGGGKSVSKIGLNEGRTNPHLPFYKLKRY